MVIVYQTASPNRLLTCLTCLVLLGSLATACVSSAASQTAQPDEAGLAARAAFLAWSVGHGIQYRGLSTDVLDVRQGVAVVEIRASVRASPTDGWQPLVVELPVQAAGDGRWKLPETALIDRVVRAKEIATVVSAERASAASVPSPTATRTVTPQATSTLPAFRPELPPPPEGSVIYESNWSTGLDGWIGTPDWKADNGKLINDGSRASRDPWIEAPVQVDPWQAMVIEAQIEVLAGEFGSYGLVARAANAGWFQFGVRWDSAAGDDGAWVAFLGMTIREQTMFSDSEVHVEPRPLEPGPHLYRAEFRDGTASFYIDGQQIDQVSGGGFTPGEFLGLWSESTPLEVHYFRVTLV